MNKFILKNYKIILLFAWILVIFMLSNEPSTISSGRSDLIVQAVSSTLHLTLSQEIMTFIVRKSAHTVAYFILGILLFNVIRSTKIKHQLSLAIAFASFYAMTDEFHQLFIAGRSCELRDVIIDTLAAAIGVAFVNLLYFYSNIFTT